VFTVITLERLHEVLKLGWGSKHKTSAVDSIDAHPIFSSSPLLIADLYASTASNDENPREHANKQHSTGILNKIGQLPRHTKKTLTSAAANANDSLDEGLLHAVSMNNTQHHSQKMKTRK
jgi:hypothetical protein